MPFLYTLIDALKKTLISIISDVIEKDFFLLFEIIN